jgi:pimeloyl-ACP methyl ester carboxylesterase
MAPELIKADVTVDVTGTCKLERPLRVVATVFLPEPDRLVTRQPVVFALPGGGYSRGYYDMHFPGHANYSQAQHLIDRGLALVAIDYLGVGESSPEVAENVGIEDIAAPNDFAARTISERLRSGTAVAGYPSVDVGARIGIGQSMGGGFTVITAARHHTYDAVAVLGFSAIRTVAPMRTHDETVRASQPFDSVRDTAPGELSVAQVTAEIADFIYPFFWEDLPADIVDADTRGGYPIRTNAPPFGSTSLPTCAVALLAPGYLKAEAAGIDVPVFIALGERDVAPEPHGEPVAYPSSTDVSLFICDRMAHMHNFASTRQKLWDRLAGWCAAVVAG